MTGGVIYEALTEGQLRTRRFGLTDHLDAWGDLRVSDLGGAGRGRLLEFTLEAPGDDLPVEIKARYREYYRRNGKGSWDIAKYHYEYLDVVRSKRFGYHLHDIGARRLVPHAHCDDAGGLADEEGPHHYRAVPLDLREAHTEFMKWWASDTAPDCTRLLPLEMVRLR